MEKIYYDELLNHKVINRAFLKGGGSLLIGCIFLMKLASDTKYPMLVILPSVAIVVTVFIFMPMRYREKTKIKELVTFYNNCIKNNKCIEVDEDLKNAFIDISKDTILNKLQMTCEPEFIYDDETKVYKVENTKVIIVNGYFEDNSISRKPKRNYTTVFLDCEYYMCYIDNLICWEKGTYWSGFYKERELKSNMIDYTKW